MAMDGMQTVVETCMQFNSEVTTTIGPISFGSNSPATTAYSASLHPTGGADSRYSWRPAALAQEEQTMIADYFHVQTIPGQIIVINLASLGDGQRIRLTSPVPPPRLYYTTFWRSITRRMFAKNQNNIILAARHTSDETEIED